MQFNLDDKFESRKNIHTIGRIFERIMCKNIRYNSQLTYFFIGTVHLYLVCAQDLGKLDKSTFTYYWCEIEHLQQQQTN